MVNKMSNTTRLLSYFRNVLVPSEIRRKCEQPGTVGPGAEVHIASGAVTQRDAWLKTELNRDLKVSTGIAGLQRASFLR